MNGVLAIKRLWSRGEGKRRGGGGLGAVLWSSNCLPHVGILHCINLFETSCACKLLAHSPAIAEVCSMD